MLSCFIPTFPGVGMPGVEPEDVVARRAVGARHQIPALAHRPLQHAAEREDRASAVDTPAVCQIAHGNTMCHRYPPCGVVIPYAYNITYGDVCQGVCLGSAGIPWIPQRRSNSPVVTMA